MEKKSKRDEDCIVISRKEFEDKLLDRERLTQKEVSFINRLMVADRYGEDETIKTKNNTLNNEEWEALLVKLESELDKLTNK